MTDDVKAYTDKAVKTAISSGLSPPKAKTINSIPWKPNPDPWRPGDNHGSASNAVAAAPLAAASGEHAAGPALLVAATI